MIVRTLETTPRGETHWSSRGMAKASGLGRTTINRIWRAFGLQPHRSETFKLSTDPLLIEKVRDIVGLYHASAGACRGVLRRREVADSGAGSHATRVADAARPGRAADARLRRHGTTTLFAALNVEDQRSDHAVSSTASLERVPAVPRRDRRAVPRHLDVHLIMDNYGTHKTPLIRNWFAKRPRFHVHFTPTYGSWLNLVERWFAELTNKQLRRGVHPQRRRSSRPRSGSSSPRIMRSRSRSSGPRPPTRFWPASRASPQRTADVQAAQLISRTIGTGH